MRPTLLILAAGMASRYGSMKQLEGFGPSGETIMDYSIFDAIRSGFKKVVFVIRKDFADAFQKDMESRWKGKIEIDYVYQELEAYTEGYPLPAGRTKPWGTAHAILCAKEAIREPFAVINADDFYGRDAYEKAVDFLQTTCREDCYSIIGYDLMNTLSDHGSVNRGVCQVNSRGELTAITERLNIKRQGNKVLCEDQQQPAELPTQTVVSMNFWCFHPSIFELTLQQFRSFLAAHSGQPKAEFFIPIVADFFIRHRGVIRVIPTRATWFGVTYKEDAPEVRAKLNLLVQQGDYPSNVLQKS
jgi:NDP-sugar pyrophosphorylase family protein